MEMTTGLVRYEAMRTAIAECYSVDEAKEIRHKARALEVYAAQAQNLDLERKASEIRLRAERRAGQLLKEMKQSGERAKPTDTLRRGPSSRAATTGKTLSDLGITRDQSSQWQELAAVPDEDFEHAVTNAGGKASTEGIILAQRAKDSQPSARMDPQALWLWGRLMDFERWGVDSRDQADLLGAMTESMREDSLRLAPTVGSWLLKVREP